MGTKSSFQRLIDEANGAEVALNADGKLTKDGESGIKVGLIKKVDKVESTEKKDVIKAVDSQLINNKKELVVKPTAASVQSMTYVENDTVYYYSYKYNILCKFKSSLLYKKLRHGFYTVEYLKGPVRADSAFPIDIVLESTDGVNYKGAGYSIDLSILYKEYIAVEEYNNSLFILPNFQIVGNEVTYVTPGLAIINGTKGTGKTTFLNAIGSNVITLGEPTSNSLPYDSVTMFRALIEAANSAFGSIDSMRLALLDSSDNVVSGGVSIALAGLITRYASFLEKNGNCVFICMNPSTMKAMAAVSEAFGASISTLIELKAYVEGDYDHPARGIRASIEVRQYDRTMREFVYKP